MASKFIDYDIADLDSLNFGDTCIVLENNREQIEKVETATAYLEFLGCTQEDINMICSYPASLDVTYREALMDRSTTSVSPKGYQPQQF